jgi:hypothetical protein
MSGNCVRTVIGLAIAATSLVSPVRADVENLYFEDFNAIAPYSAPANTNGYGDPLSFYSYAGNDGAAVTGVQRVEGVDADGVGGSSAIFQSVDSSGVVVAGGGQTWWYAGLGRYVYNDPFTGGAYSLASQVSWTADMKGTGLSPSQQDAMMMHFYVQKGGGLADAKRLVQNQFLDSSYQTLGGTLDTFTEESFDDDNNSATPNGTGTGFSGAYSFVAQFDYLTAGWGNDAGNKFSVDNFKISVVRPNWKGASGDSYTDASKWSESEVPNSVTSFPIFRTAAVSGAQSVVLNSAITVNRLDFNSTDDYTLSGSGNITIQGDSPGAIVHEGSDATHTIQLPVHIDKANAGIRVNAGNGHLELAGGLTSTGVVGKDREGFLAAKYIRAQGLNILGGEVALYGGQTTTSKLNTLTISTTTASAHLDVRTAKLIVDYTGASPLATLRADRAAGRIMSSTTVAGTVVLIAEASDFVGMTSFGDQSVDATSILVTLALRGDSNLSNRVDFDDLLKLAHNYGITTGGTWSKGDSNDDGQVNFDDLLALAQNYNASLLSNGQLTQLDSTFAADFALALSMVPEPASLSLLALGAVLPRRRHVAMTRGVC